MGWTRGRELARKSGVGWEGRRLGFQPLKLPSLEEAAGRIRDGCLLWTTQGAGIGEPQDEGCQGGSAGVSDMSYGEIGLWVLTARGRGW